MPTYEYVCKDCGEGLEVVQSFHDDALTVCPACSGALRKVFSAAGIIFKGSGWHIKDYASSSNSSPSSSSDSPPDSSSDSSTGSGSSNGDSTAGSSDTSSTSSTSSSDSTSSRGDKPARTTRSGSSD